jgi:hypothetical protein
VNKFSPPILYKTKLEIHALSFKQCHDNKAVVLQAEKNAYRLPVA